MMFTGQRSVFRNQANNEDRKWLFHLERGTKLCAAQKMPKLSRRRRKSRRLGRIDQWTIVIWNIVITFIGLRDHTGPPRSVPGRHSIGRARSPNGAEPVQQAKGLLCE